MLVPWQPGDVLSCACPTPLCCRSPPLARGVRCPPPSAHVSSAHASADAAGLLQGGPGVGQCRRAQQRHPPPGRAPQVRTLLLVAVLLVCVVCAVHVRMHALQPAGRCLVYAAQSLHSCTCLAIIYLPLLSPPPLFNAWPAAAAAGHAAPTCLPDCPVHAAAGFWAPPLQT